MALHGVWGWEFVILPCNDPAVCPCALRAAGGATTWQSASLGAPGHSPAMSCRKNQVVFYGKILLIKKQSQWTKRSVNLNFIFLFHYPRDTMFNTQTPKQSWPPHVHHLLPNTQQPLVWRERWGHTVEFRNANSTFMLPSNQGCCVTTAREWGQLS